MLSELIVTQNANKAIFEEATKRSDFEFLSKITGADPGKHAFSCWNYKLVFQKVAVNYPRFSVRFILKSSTIKMCFHVIEESMI